MLVRAVEGGARRGGRRVGGQGGGRGGGAGGWAGGFLGGMAGGGLANAGQPTPPEEGQAPHPEAANPPEGTVTPAPGEGPTLQVEPPPGDQAEAPAPGPPGKAPAPLPREPPDLPPPRPPLPA